MSGEMSKQQPGERSPSAPVAKREEVLTALIVLLGPDTDAARRGRAASELAQRGSEILPMLLQTRQTHPLIYGAVWPGWPPQYEQLARLLVQLSLHGRLSLPELLRTHDLP